MSIKLHRDTAKTPLKIKKFYFFEFIVLLNISKYTSASFFPIGTTRLGLGFNLFLRQK